LVRVYRRMGKLRRALITLRSRDFFYFNTQSRPAEEVIAFQRRATAARQTQTALVVLNFSDQDRTLALGAPVPGIYREMLDRLNRGGVELDLAAANSGDALTISVPSNYGCVFVTPPPAPGI